MQSNNLKHYQHQINLDPLSSIKSCLAKNLENISLALKNPNPTWENLITVLEEAERNIEQHWAYFSHLHAVQNTSKIRKIYNRCLPLLVKYETKLLQYTK